MIDNLKKIVIENGPRIKENLLRNLIPELNFELQRIYFSLKEIWRIEKNDELNEFLEKLGKMIVKYADKIEYELEENDYAYKEYAELVRDDIIKTLNECAPVGYEFREIDRNVYGFIQDDEYFNDAKVYQYTLVYPF